MNSISTLVFSSLLLILVILLIFFTTKIVSKLIFARSLDSPFACLQHAPPDIRFYVALTPGQHPYFRVLEEYGQKLDSLATVEEVHEDKKDKQILVL